MYFNKLGTTQYNDITIPDIFKRIVPISAEFGKSDLFEQYEISEAETPESLSFSYYGRVDYYWVILITNNIKSRFFDWPMSSKELGSYIESKYGNKSALFFEDNSLLGFDKFGEVTYVVKGNYKFKVFNADRNLNKLEIEKITPSQLLQESNVNFLDKDEKVLTGKQVSRIVYENEQALHHINFLVENRLMLNSYIKNNVGTNDIFVSNANYESAENEKRRNIFLLKPQYIGAFVSNFKSLAQAD
jgi:hypothetical protein